MQNLRAHGTEIVGIVPRSLQGTRLHSEVHASCDRMEVWGGGINTPMRNLGAFALEVMTATRILKRLRLDNLVVVLPWPRRVFSWLLAAELLQVPSLAYHQLVAPDITFSRTERNILRRQAEKHQLAIVAVSESNKNLLCSALGLDSSQVKVVWNGADSVTSIPTTRNSDVSSKAKEALGYEDSHIIIATTGRLARQKGHHLIVPAIPHIVRECPGTRFLWVGDGEERQNLQNQLREYRCLEYVRITGWVDDVSRCLDISDYFLFPSLFEGLPLSPLEAMMHRLPVIISDATGNRDLFEDRSDGLVFRNGDSCDLMECVNYALANPEAMKILAEKAMKKLNLFSEVRMLEEFQSIVSTSFADRP